MHSGVPASNAIPMPETFRLRKRNRLTVVCRRCRVKKAKCDKQMPCSKCVSAGCADTCSYEARPAADDTDDGHLKENIVRRISAHDARDDAHFSPAARALPFSPISVENNALLVGVNPVVRSADTINMHMDLAALGASPQDAPTNLSFHTFKTYIKPTHFLEVTMQEPGARFFWALVDREEKLRLMTLLNFEPQRRDDVEKAAQAYFGPRYIASTLAKSPQTCKIVSEYGQYLGLSFTEGYTDDESPKTSLRRVLPRHRASLIAYIDRFFAKVYPIYPVVDEGWVRKQVDRVLEYSPTGDVLMRVNIASRDDLVVLSLLLFMLRLAYLSFFTCVRKQNEVMLKTTRVGPVAMIDAQITVNAVDLAYRLYNEGSYRRKVLLLFLQTSLLRYITRIHAQDSELVGYSTDEEGGCGHVMQMAVSLGMERDPDIGWRGTVGAKSSNLQRKIWYVLLQLDYSMSYLFHTPRIVTANAYDTCLPTFSRETSNIENLELEARVIELLRVTSEAVIAGTDLLDLCLDLKLSHKVMEVIEKLTDFEIILHEKLGSLLRYFRSKDSPDALSVTNIPHLRTLFVSKLFLVNVYFFLHLYYNFKSQADIDNFFMRKVLLILYTELNYFSTELLFLENPMFDGMFYMTICPVIQVYLQVVAMTGLGLAVRLNCSIILMESSGEKSSQRLQLLKAFSYRNEAYVLRKLKLSKVLSERFFFTWKCTKTNAFGYRTIFLNQLYLNNIDALEQATIVWSERQLRDTMTAIPEDVPLQPTDFPLFVESSYSSVRGIDDAELQGDDLLKTVQTDNFWVVLNFLVGKDTSTGSIFVKVEENNDVSVAETRLPTPFVSDRSDTLDSGLQTDNPYPVPTAGPEPNAFELLEFNLFSTDWTIDDFFPLQSGG